LKNFSGERKPRHERCNARRSLEMGARARTRSKRLQRDGAASGIEIERDLKNQADCKKGKTSIL